VSIAQYIGLNYLPKGRTAEGVDCWGLVQLFYRNELHLDVPSYDDQYLNPTDRGSVSKTIIDNMGHWAKVQEQEYGDVLLFEILGLPLHTGIYIGDGDFLHAFKNTNSCIERLKSITWNRRLLGAFRWTKV